MRIRFADTNGETLLLRMRLAFLADHRKTTVETFSGDFVTATEDFLAQKMRSETMTLGCLTEECLGLRVHAVVRYGD
jgi:hypothetical protein